MSREHRANENERQAPDIMFTSNHAEFRLKVLNRAKRISTCDSKMCSLQKNKPLCLKHNRMGIHTGRGGSETEIW